MIQEYVEYDGRRLLTSHNVLVWNKKDGYHFTKFGFVNSSTKVVGMQE